MCKAASPGSDLRVGVALSSSLRSAKTPPLASSSPAPAAKGLACLGLARLANVNGEAEPPSPPFSPGVTTGHRAIYIYNSPTAPDSGGANQQPPSLSDSVCSNQEVLSLQPLSLSLFESEVGCRPLWGGDPDSEFCSPKSVSWCSPPEGGTC